MKLSPYNLNVKKLIILFFLFVLSTCALFILILFPLNNIVKQVLFYFGFFGLGVVILSIFFHYISKANKWLNQDKARLIVTIAIILALCHASFIGRAEASWFYFGGYLAGDGLIIILGILGYKAWLKKKNSNKLKKK